MVIREESGPFSAICTAIKEMSGFFAVLKLCFGFATTGLSTIDRGSSANQSAGFLIDLQ